MLYCPVFHAHTHTAPSGPPQSVTATEITSISITIRWDRVSCTDRNSEITGYTVQYGQSGSGAIITETINGTVDSARLITTIGLTADTSYTYQVAAFSSEGTGPFSTDITVTTAGLNMHNSYTYTLHINGGIHI